MTLWTPYSDGAVFEYHPGTDLATSIRNHVTGTDDASVNGSWTGDVGYQNISGVGPLGLDFGFPVTGRYGHIATVVDPGTGVCIIGSSGTTPAVEALCRIWMHAQPANGATISINSQTITFRTSGATGFEVNIGATVQDTAYALSALINANTATFACTSYCPPLNSVQELTSVATGTAANSLAVSSSTSNVQFTARNGLTSVTSFGSGAAGVTVTAGIYHASTSLQGRNSNQGVGGLATVSTTSLSTGYYYMSCPLEERNFPKLWVYSGGALAHRGQAPSGSATDFTPGNTRATSGNLTSGLTGGGTGSAKQSYAAYWNRALTEAEDLANYLAVKAELALIGITVN